MGARTLGLPVLIAAALRWFRPWARLAPDAPDPVEGFTTSAISGDITNSGAINLDPELVFPAGLGQERSRNAEDRRPGRGTSSTTSVTRHEMWQPSVWLVTAGGMLYGGAGIGIGYTPTETGRRTRSTRAGRGRRFTPRRLRPRRIRHLPVPERCRAQEES